MASSLPKQMRTAIVYTRYLEVKLSVCHSSRFMLSSSLFFCSVPKNMTSFISRFTENRAELLVLLLFLALRNKKRNSNKGIEKALASRKAYSQAVGLFFVFKTIENLLYMWPHDFAVGLIIQRWYIWRRQLSCKIAWNVGETLPTV